MDVSGEDRLYVIPRHASDSRGVEPRCDPTANRRMPQIMGRASEPHPRSASPDQRSEFAVYGSAGAHDAPHFGIGDVSRHAKRNVPGLNTGCRLRTAPSVKERKLRASGRSVRASALSELLSAQGKVDASICKP
jgi:hypothetical protein